MLIADWPVARTTLSTIRHTDAPDCVLRQPSPPAVFLLLEFKTIAVFSQEATD
jgi:hypothetical protein